MQQDQKKHNYQIATNEGNEHKKVQKVVLSLVSKKHSFCYENMLILLCCHYCCAIFLHISCSTKVELYYFCESFFSRIHLPSETKCKLAPVLYGSLFMN